MDYTELIEQRNLKLADLEGIVNKGKVEERKLTEEENTAFETIKSELEELDRQIEEKRNMNDNNNNKNIIIKNTNKMENFSLLKSIRDIVEGRNYSDSTLSLLEVGKENFKKAGLSYRGQLALPYEYRANEVLAGTAGVGQEVVSEDKFALLPYLRANSILVASGAQLLNGLVGDVSIPILGTGSTANWATETGASVVSPIGMGEVTLSPKRLTTYIDISKQFLIQDSVQAEAMLRNDIMASITDKLENTILGSAASSATQPAGMFYGAAYTYSGATTWPYIVSLETAVANNNALKNNAAYLIHPSALGNLKTTGKATNQAIFIAENSTINGYPFYTSTNLPTFNTTYRGVIFGVMSDLVIGSWGGLDLTVDPYSQAVNGKIRIIVNAYFDAAKRRTVSFAYGSHLVS